MGAKRPPTLAMVTPLQFCAPYEADYAKNPPKVRNHS